MVLTRGSGVLEREAPPGSLVDLVYENEAGQVSRRRVEIVRWSRAGNGFTYLRAFCYLREEERTFRTDRIVEWQIAERDALARQAAERQSSAFPRPVVTFVPLEVPAPPRATVPTSVAIPSQDAVSAASKQRRGHGFLAFGGAALAIWLLRGLVAAGEPPQPRYVPAPVPAPSPTPKPVVVPAPKPVPAADPGVVEPSPDDVPAVISVAQDGRPLAFRSATGIEDARLEALYESADSGGDGALDWRELAAFQAWLDRTYAYWSNVPALRPDEFIAQGGGDCEDWALFTCGLLRYWGWDPYVGSFAGSDRGTGHAVCLVRVAERPKRYRAWSVDADGYLGGQPVKAGWYVPVDYEVVGDLSNAVGGGWQLRVIWTPERIYGEVM